KVLIKRSMEILRAALGNDPDLAPGGAAILGVVIGGQNLNFLCGIEVGGSDAEGCVGAGPNSYGAIEKDCIVLAARAVDVEVTGRQAEIVAVQQPADDTGLCQGQKKRVSPIEFSELNLFAVNQLSERGCFCLHLGR